MEKVRKPAVAGQFYPANPPKLRQMAQGYLDAAAATEPPPKAIIAPHAGYVYSGPIAGTAYAHWQRRPNAIRRVALLGPAHRVPVRGLAASAADAFVTPLGRVPLDKPAHAQLLALPQVAVSDAAHAREHSLEVHLPFLQVILPEFTLIPLVVGAAEPEEVAEVLAQVWGGPETVVVISSDLSHFYDYATATRLDRETSEAIEALRPLREGQACGCRAINGLLHLARQRGLRATTLDLRNSGDTSGRRREVVGYGAYGFWEA